jgi:PAS domain S-box-containing protein
VDLKDGISNSEHKELHILILEDAPADAELIESELKKGGIVFISKRVDTENAFRRMLDEFSPDLILSDYHLPTFSGMSALMIALGKCPETPFIFISGAMGEELAVEMLKKGATDYVIKDRLKRIVPAVQRALKEKEERTKHKLTEKSLIESKERYRRITAAISDYIYKVRVENGMPVETTHGEACSIVTGYTSEDFLSDPHLWLRMVLKEDQDLVRKQAGEALAGHPAKPAEHRIVRKDGQIRWVESTIVPNYNAQGNLLSYDGILRDITERKNIEAQLLHSQKMEAVGRLAGGMAHDFNNILAAIVNYLYLLRSSLNDNASAQTDIDRIYSLAMKASEITKGLLAFSRNHIADFVPVNLNDAVKNMVKLLSKFIGEDIRLDVRLIDKSLIIMADITQIEQIIINLATNARDAMMDGGSIIIKTELIAVDDEFISGLGLVKPGTYARLTFADTGTGMDEETRQRIFEPFYTTKESGKGSGLGLSIIYGIVKQHAGYINVSSVPGRGATFAIYFQTVDSAVAGKTVTRPLDLTGNAETILVAEDAAEVRNSTKFILERFGYKVIEASDGEDAIRKFNENRDNIDLLFFDVIMPHMNGREAYEEIKKIEPGIRAVFASGYSAEILDKERIVKDGLKFVSKPLSPDKLLSTIKEALQNG